MLWAIRGTDLGLRERQVAPGRGLGERKRGAEGICLATCQNGKQKQPNPNCGLKGERRLPLMRNGQLGVK